MKSQFLIAAPSSNSGKTTITLGLLQLFKDRGYKVQPFKCGPDYIDTKHHTIAADCQSINLDTYLMSKLHVQQLYQQYSQPADIVVVEGVMGLFDGASNAKGSSAEIAIILDLPIILVVNAKAMGYSAAALLYGFKNFNPNIKIAGVIFNNVSTQSHYSYLKDACLDVGLESLGYLPNNPAIAIASRYLGLTIDPKNNYQTIIQKAAQHLEKHLAIDKILNIGNFTQTTNSLNIPTTTTGPKKYTIAVAKDAAFNFIYHQNIEALKKHATIVYFSPLTDTQIPNTDMLYLAGGYPELYLQPLHENISMRKSILDFCTNGGKVFAECGGMMYLGSTITNKEGQQYTMVGFLPIQSTMQNAKLSLGYRLVEYKNWVLLGHEFHYSTLQEQKEITTIGKVFNAKNIRVNTPIYKVKNVVASYIHFYWAEIDFVKFIESGN